MLPEDPSAPALQEKIREKGIDSVITEVSGIGADEPLFQTVRRVYDMLQAGEPLAKIILRAAEIAVQEESACQKM